MTRTYGLAALGGYIATIFLANYSIGHWGTTCMPDGPCLVPVGFGLTAPSGVLWVGLTLFLRDLVQNSLGRTWALVGIVAGAALSLLVSAPAIALASGAAFLAGEVADFAVYTPLREKRLTLAVLASGIVGAVVDSALFLSLAFGSLDFIVGQVVGKVAMTILCALAVWVWKNKAEWQRQRLRPI